MASDGSIRISTELDTAGLQSSLDKMNSMVEKGMKIAEMSIMGLAVGEGFKKLAEAGIEFDMQMQTLQASFETMTGSAEQAANVIAGLKKMAPVTPFEVTNLAEASKLMMTFGESTSNLMPDLKMLGDISQGNNEKLQSLARIFGEVQSKGSMLEKDVLGNNYLRGLLALGFQGFFLMVCVGIYAVLVNDMIIATNVHSAIFSVAAYTVLLCFAMMKTGSLSRTIFNTH